MKQMISIKRGTASQISSPKAPPAGSGDQTAIKEATILSTDKIDIEKTPAEVTDKKKSWQSAVANSNTYKKRSWQSEDANIIWKKHSKPNICTQNTSYCI